VSEVVLSRLDAGTVLVLVVLSFGFIDGARRGLLGASFITLATLVALAVTSSQYYLVSRLIQFVLNLDERTCAVFGFSITLFAMLIVSYAAAGLLVRILKEKSVSGMSRLMGGLAGLLSIYLVVSVVLCLILASPIDPLTSHVLGSGVLMAVVQSGPPLLRVVGVDLPEILVVPSSQI